MKPTAKIYLQAIIYLCEESMNTRYTTIWYSLQNIDVWEFEAQKNELGYHSWLLMSRGPSWIWTTACYWTNISMSILIDGNELMEYVTVILKHLIISNYISEELFLL